MILEPNPNDIPVFAVQNLVDAQTGENNVVEPSNERKTYGLFPSGVKPERSYLNWLYRLTYLNFDWLKETFFVEVDHYIETMYNQLGILGPAVDGHTTRIAAAESNINSIGLRVGDTEDDIGALQSQVTSFGGRLTTAEGEIDTLQNGVTALQSVLVDYHNCHFSTSDMTTVVNSQVGVKTIGGFKHVHFWAMEGISNSTTLRLYFDGNIPAVFLTENFPEVSPFILYHPMLVGGFVSGMVKLNTVNQCFDFYTTDSTGKLISTGFSSGNRKGFPSQTIVYR